MAGPRVGSLFTGTGALDLAVMDVFGGETVWHSQYEPPDKKGRPDTNQYAAKILARHWPDVPNLGDVTAIDWQAVLDEHGPIDILTGGFPCQDVSSAGKRAGLTADSRSGLWAHFARAVHELRPRLVVIENVQGLLSAKADRGLEPGAEALDTDPGAGGLLRALGAVLGDLATLGLDAEWARVAASEVGAPHPRKRVFILAWPADANPANLGHEWSRGARRRRHGPADCSLVAANTGCQGLEVGRVEPDGTELPTAERGRREPVADEPACPTCGCDESFHDAGGFCAGCHECTDPDLGRPDEATADTDGFRRGNGPRIVGGLGTAGRSAEADADTGNSGRRAGVLNLRPGQPDLDWGDYGPAIHRWERILGRPAPWPTDALGRLSPVFTEWLMGLPDGWVTDTPGLTRSAMLRALGNGVVRRQAEAALRLLAARSEAAGAAAA